MSREGGNRHVYSGSQELASVSANRVPTASTRSALRVYEFVVWVPQKPGIPSTSGWSSGTVPFAISEWTIGASRSSASSTTAARPSSPRRPPPR